MPNQKIYKNMEHAVNKLGMDFLPVDVLHGFLSAVICSPTMILPSEWLPFLLKDENDVEYDFEDQKQAEKFIKALMDFYNDILNDILNDDYSPYIRDEDGTLDVKPWCLGFSYGMKLRIDEWQEGISNELFDYLVPIYYFADKETFLSLFEKELLSDLVMKPEELLDDLIYVVPAIYSFWNENDEADGEDNNDRDDESVDASNMDAFNRVIDACIHPMNFSALHVGRNEPCPCGSGKKFKNCCGRGH